MEYKVRNYSDELFAKLADFYRETIGGVFHSIKKGHRFLEKILLKPHFDPKRDLFVAEMGDTVVGLLLIISERKINRIVLNCYVHHNFPYQRAASALWEKGIHRCHEIGPGRNRKNMTAGRTPVGGMARMPANKENTTDGENPDDNIGQTMPSGCRREDEGQQSNQQGGAQLQNQPNIQNLLSMTSV